MGEGVTALLASSPVLALVVPVVTSPVGAHVAECYLTARPNLWGCHDPQCWDSTWDHKCPAPPCWVGSSEPARPVSMDG